MAIKRIFLNKITCYTNYCNCNKLVYNLIVCLIDLKKIFCLNILFCQHLNNECLKMYIYVFSIFSITKRTTVI